MYYIEHRKIGYVVYETEDLEAARAEKKALGRAFKIVDENGNEIK
jgi:hypothetical protein